MKAESFDVEEEVGRRWSTDGRWDGVGPPQHQDRSLLKLLLGLNVLLGAASAANVVPESVARVLVRNAVRALSSFQLKCAMLRAHW